MTLCRSNKYQTLAYIVNHFVFHLNKLNEIDRHLMIPEAECMLSIIQISFGGGKN